MIDDVVTPISMERMLALFATDVSLDLVGSFTAGAASTEKRDYMYIPFPLLPYVLGQNKTGQIENLESG